MARGRLQWLLSNDALSGAFTLFSVPGHERDLQLISERNVNGIGATEPEMNC